MYTECCQQADDYNGLQAYMHHSFAGVGVVQTPCVCLHLLSVPEPSHLHIKALHKAWISLLCLAQASALCSLTLSPGSRRHAICAANRPEQDTCGNP